MAVLQMDRSYFPFRLATRNDATGLWDTEDIPTTQVQVKKIMPVDHHEKPFIHLDSSLYPANEVVRSMVAIECHLPYLIEGDSKTSIGFIAQACKSLSRMESALSLTRHLA
jgi:hypothetical protein